MTSADPVKVREYSRRYRRTHRSYCTAYMRYYRSLLTYKPLPKPTPTRDFHASP